MKRPKLILLHGFAGVGKSTIAKRYIDEHPLALDIEGDRLIVMLGQWLAHEAEARTIVFEHTKSLAATHLSLGKDVVITYLLTDAAHAEAFETLAKDHGADYVEVLLSVERDQAISRLLKRGTWGEEGLDPLTEKDLPAIEEVWGTMVAAIKKRPHSIVVQAHEGDIDRTYEEFLAGCA